MYPGPGQIGCAYTGRGGGPTRTEIPTAICPKDAAENTKIIPANIIQRMIDRFMLSYALPKICLDCDAECLPRLLTHHPYKHKITEDVALQNQFEM
jgi:hypothetical protein